ncbi:MAG: DUF721 domain-containing protein [Rickettsiaceae bacterium]|nr:DUF721 domain-containing protein [Rickettsiaceae bacterium]
MKPIIDSVHQIIFKIYEAKNPILAELIIHWKEIIGCDLAKLSAPTKLTTNVINGIKHNILYISVDNSSISLEMSYKQDLFIERIALYFGYKAVHKIRLVIRDVKDVYKRF